MHLHPNVLIGRVDLMKLNVKRIDLLIQVDISGYQPFPTVSKLFSGNFGNLLFLAVFSGPELPEPF
jgi:hypothetical protein